MVFLIERYRDIKFYNLLGRRDENIVIRKDYMEFFLKNPSIFVKKNKGIEYLKAYLLSPKKLEFKKEVHRFLTVDKILQSARKVTRKIIVEYHLLIIGAIIFTILAKSIHPYKYMYILTLVVVGLLGIFPRIFYFTDQLITIFSVIKSILKGSSEFIAKSYLDLTKIKSSNYDFIYYDKTITEEDINFYERCINELINIFPNIIYYRFNVLVVDKHSNTLDESRKMIGVYDSLNFKIYDYHPSSIGLYNPAGATIICKCIDKDYVNNLLENYNPREFNPEALEYINSINKDNNTNSLRKHILYHEFAHMISANINQDFFFTEEFQKAFDTEKYLIFPEGDSYFLNDFNEFIAEIIANYLEILISKQDNVNYTNTKVYDMVKCYLECANLNLKQDVTV